MNKNFLILFLNCFFCMAIAQPGHLYQIKGNLNTIDSAAIKKCLALKDLCNFNSVIIDSTTNLKRLNHLNHTTNLSFYLDVALPDYVKNIELNKIKSITLSLGNTAKISNLPLLDSLKTISIYGYMKKDLIIENKMKSLEELNIQNSDSIINIDTFLQKNTISSLKINNCKNLKLNSEVNLEKIKHLSINNSNNFLVNLKKIGRFKNLESLVIDNISITSFPKDFPKNIKSIVFNNSRLSLGVLIKLKEMKNLTTLKIINSNIEFKAN